MQAVRRLQFCAGHRVLDHESKCANAHGHNYVAYFHAESQGLDKLGRVIDFSVLKERIGKWIDENWDHAFIVFKDDRELIAALKDHKLFALGQNPTAENMAQFLLDEICPEVLQGTGVEVVKVVLWETENCYVEAAL